MIRKLPAAVAIAYIWLVVNEGAGQKMWMCSLFFMGWDDKVSNLILKIWEIIVLLLGGGTSRPRLCGGGGRGGRDDVGPGGRVPAVGALLQPDVHAQRGGVLRRPAQPDRLPPDPGAAPQGHLHLPALVRAAGRGRGAHRG